MAKYQIYDAEAPVIRLCNRQLVHSLYAFSDKANIAIHPCAALPKANGVVKLRQVDLAILADIGEGDFLDKVYSTLNTDHPDLHRITTLSEIKSLYSKSQENRSEAASWDYIRSALLLQKLERQSLDPRPIVSLQAVEDKVDIHREYSTTKRAGFIWQWINDNIDKEVIYHG